MGYSVTNLCDMATYRDQMVQNGMPWDIPGPIRISYAPPIKKNPNFQPVGGGFGFLVYSFEIYENRK